MTARRFVVGGGPAGLAVAYHAVRRRVSVELFEREAEVGGLCRTFACGPHRYDAGAHRFHDRDADVTAEVRALLGDRLVTVDARSCIFDGHRFVAFPPTPLAMLLSGGLRDVARIGRDLLRGRRAGMPRVSFADFAVAEFGETLARRFLINYTQKLWGLPADRLAPDVATRRLTGMTLRSLVLELVAPRWKAQHIDGRFLYPKGGYGEIPAALARALPIGTIRAAHEVVDVEHDGRRIRRLRFAGHPAREVDGRVVWTLPLTLLVRLLGDWVPSAVQDAARALRFRSVRVVFLRLACPRISPYASVYLPDETLCVARVSEPKSRSAEMAPPDESGLVAEVPCSAGDAIDLLPDAALIERVVRELSGLGLFSRSAVIDARHHLLRNAYPVYALDWSRNLAVVTDALRAIENVDLIGRAGLFFYSHLHDQMRLAKEYVTASSDRGSQSTGVEASVHDRRVGRDLEGLAGYATGRDGMPVRDRDESPPRN